MIEQQPKEAGFWKKAQVGALLWLERYLEKKPETLADLKRREFLKSATVGTLGVALVSSGGIGVFKFLQGLELKQPLPVEIPKPPAPNKPEGYYSADWQGQEEVLQLLEKARENQGLLILEPNPIRFRAVKNNFFYQTTNGVILAIDKEATEAWLSQYPKINQSVALIYTDKLNPAISRGAASFYEDFDELWQNYIKGQTPEQMGHNLTSHLSAGVALVNDYVNQYGPNKAIQILSISQKGTPQWQIVQEKFWDYIDQFRNGQLTPLIKVIAINPLWIKQKLQTQQP